MLRAYAHEGSSPSTPIVAALVKLECTFMIDRIEIALRLFQINVTYLDNVSSTAGDLRLMDDASILSYLQFADRVIALDLTIPVGTTRPKY